MARKILIVDDDTAACKVLAKYLVGKGYSVVKAYSGDEALEIYKQERPDMVLLDIRMPDKDGLETLGDLRALDPEASVIIVTALHERDLVRKAKDEGALDYITKPIDLNYLSALLMESGIMNGGRSK